MRRNSARWSACACVGAYYLARGVGSGAKKWLFFGEGKAWCLSAKDCLGRTKAPDGRGGWMASNGAALRTLTKPSNQRAHTDRPKCRNAHTLRFTLFCAARLKTDFALLDCSARHTATETHRNAVRCYAALTLNRQLTEAYPAWHMVNGTRQLSDDPLTNPTLYNWNIVWVKTCDGGSWTGNRQEPDVVEGTALYYRGRKILDAMVDDLIPRGILNATVRCVTDSQREASGRGWLFVPAELSSRAVVGVCTRVRDRTWWLAEAVLVHLECI